MKKSDNRKFSYKIAFVLFSWVCTKGSNFVKPHHHNIRSSYDEKAKGNFKKYQENLAMTDAEFKFREFSETFKNAWVIPPARLKNLKTSSK